MATIERGRNVFTVTVTNSFGFLTGVSQIQTQCTVYIHTSRLKEHTQH